MVFKPLDWAFLGFALGFLAGVFLVISQAKATGWGHQPPPCISREEIVAEIMAGNPTAEVRLAIGDEVKSLARRFNEAPPATDILPAAAWIFTKPRVPNLLVVFIDANGCRIATASMGL